MKRYLFALAAMCALHAAVPSAIAIRNARIVPVSSAVIPHGTVVLRNGLIEAVGANVPIPPDAWVIEGDGLTVYPGLIDALSSVGIPEAAAPATTGGGGGRGAAPAVNVTIATPARGPEDRPSTTSWLKAADMVRPADRHVEAAR